MNVEEPTWTNEDPHRRSLRAFRQRAATAATRQGKHSSSVAIVEVRPELNRVEDAYEDNRDINYDALSDKKLDDDV